MTLCADIVAKRFFASRRATLIQKIDAPRKIDSSGAPIGFESCALGGGRRLLQQNLPIADVIPVLKLLPRGSKSVLISAIPCKPHACFS
jgi:hypothetical protein